MTHKKEKKTKQKTRSLNQQKKKIRKTHVSFPNFLAAQNTTPFNKQLTLTVSGRDLQRARSLAQDRFGDEPFPLLLKKAHHRRVWLN